MITKFYAIRRGRKTGIFIDSWDIVKEHVQGYPKAEYKSFKTLEEAELFMETGYEYKNQETKKIMNTNPDLFKDDIWDEKNEDYSGLLFFTDGSVEYANKEPEFKSVPTGTSFGVVGIQDGEVIVAKSQAFDDAFNDKRNVVGEIRGVIYALLKAQSLGAKKVTICFDYKGIALWNQDFMGEKRWRAKNQLTQKYVQIVSEFSKDMEIKFKKVKAHSNIKYNEIADNLANDAFVPEHPYLNNFKLEHNIKD